MKKEVEVRFKTITPLWTGDAWGECKEIKPSAIMGSLRFWFALYWNIKKRQNTETLNKNGIPDNNLSKLEKPNENKTFEKFLIKNIFQTQDFDEAIDKALDELGLPVPSRIFGCTGWKSRINIKIEEFSRNEFNFSNLEKKFPLNFLNINSGFWIENSLFDKNEEITLFTDIKTKLITTEYWWDNYLKDFFEFFQDKIILVGGKKSFGFGFVNMVIDEENNERQISSWDNHLKIEKIDSIQYSEEKEILGFNFKYFLRKKEDKKDRKNNFGTQGQASKIYVSNLLRSLSGSYIYLLVLNSPFERNKIPENIIEKYKGWLNNLEGESNG